MFRYFCLLIICVFWVACDQPAVKPVAAQDNNVLAQTQLVVQNLSATEAYSAIEAQDDLSVLDVRTPGEFAAGHIDDAELIDFRSADFKARLDHLDRQTPYLVHCRSGGRSGKTIRIMRDMGFTNILHLDGGYLAWEKAGLPIVK